MNMVAARATWMLEQGVDEAALRITSKCNLWADMGSRGEQELMARQAVNLGLHVERVQLQPAWRHADYLLQLDGETI